MGSEVDRLKRGALFPMTKKTFSTLGVQVAAVLLLAGLVLGCGGSGGGGSPTEPGGVSNSEVEFQSFELVNGERSDHDVEPQLGLRELVSAAARTHSENMRDEGFFGHRDPNGKELSTRLNAAGVQFSRAAENIVKVNGGANPALAAHQLLVDSEPHLNNILDSKYQLAGVGVARLGDTFWLTQIFIKP